jgi:hypothetical protein
VALGLLLWSKSKLAVENPLLLFPDLSVRSLSTIVEFKPCKVRDITSPEYIPVFAPKEILLKEDISELLNSLFHILTSSILPMNEPLKPVPIITESEFPTG